MKKYYLAYGSNLDTEAMAHRCPNAKAVATAMIDGYELLFRGGIGSYLTIEKKDGGSVPVAVWEVDESDEMKLDRYEGYPHLYYKTDMDITYTERESGQEHSVTTFVYIMRENFSLGVPSGSYLRICMEGYETFGFDKRYLTNALTRSIGREGSR